MGLGLLKGFALNVGGKERRFKRNQSNLTKMVK